MDDDRSWRFRLEHEVQKLKEGRTIMWVFIGLIIFGLVFGLTR